MSDDMIFFDGVWFDENGYQPNGNGSGQIGLLKTQSGWMIMDDYGHGIQPIVWENHTTISAGAGAFTPDDIEEFCILTGTRPKAKATP